MKTEQAYYKVIIDLDDKEINLRNRNNGVLVTNGEYSSLVSKVFKKTISIFIRESEF